jgi:hypothetical protein
MRSITILIFACACALASGYYQKKDVHYADSTFLVKQKAFFDVLQHVHQNDVFTKLYEESKTFNLLEWREHFTKPHVVDEFDFMYKHGMLPMNEIFTIMNKEHLEEVISLFHVFYYAKDWDTFYKTMVWARFHVNEGQFLYALTVAVLHRHDMVGIVLPAPYEIYPYYFFSSEVVQKAQLYKMQGFYGMKKVEDTYTVIIPANYTGYYTHTSDEHKISYFTEDIGLNSYYYYFHADYPFWMGGDEFGLKNDRRGEFYFYQYQQILARYYLERLSNDLGEIPELSYYEPIEEGYYPDLRYYNGEYFPVRTNHYTVYHERNFYEVELVEDYEYRIRTAIDHGFVLLPDGTHLDLTKPESIEYLGNFFQANPDSKFPRYFGHLAWFAKWLLGTSARHTEYHHGNFHASHHYIPSVLEHYETAMRDPVFYQLYKRFLKYYYQFQDHLPYYKHEDLEFKGVKIDSVEIDKLVTYFDKFDSDITNVVDIEMFEDKTHMSPLHKFGRFAHYNGYDVLIKARQWRLNHLPFTFKLHVHSDKVQKAIVKVFIGPKYDSFGHVYDVEENRENFYELDHFFVELVEGKNDIVRNSEDFSWFVKDRTTFYELYKQLMLSIKGDVKFPLDMTEAHCGLPMRLMLPKGKKGGMPFQFFFMVMPYYAPKVERFTGFDSTMSCGVGSGARYLDTLPFGFPFNRHIDEHHWYTDNMYYYDVNIFHKRETEINAAH